MLSYETYCLALTIFIVFVTIFFINILFHSKNQSWMQNDIHGDKTHGQ